MPPAHRYKSKANEAEKQRIKDRNSVINAKKQNCKENNEYDYGIQGITLFVASHRSRRFTSYIIIITEIECTYKIEALVAGGRRSIIFCSWLLD